MRLLADGSWERRSRTLGAEEPDGRYFLRPIVTGDGEPGKYYNDWVKARGGRPITIVEEQIA